MFKVETNKLNKVVDYIKGFACVAVVAIMVFFYKDLNAYFDDATMKIVASVIYIGCMILMLFFVYVCLDHAAMYMVVERNEFRIKHLFRKEVTFTRGQLTKWKCFTQLLRTGQTSENIVIHFGKKSRVEFAVNENTNFERLLNHLRANYKREEE